MDQRRQIRGFRREDARKGTDPSALVPRYACVSPFFAWNESLDEGHTERLRQRGNSGMNFPHGVKGNDVESNVIGPREVNSLILRSWRVVAIFPLLYFAVCLLLFCERVLAQSVIVQPTKLEASGEPGQSVDGERR